MTEKRDTYIERKVVLEKIQKLKKSVEGLENKRDKIDEISFDVKTKSFIKSKVLEMEKIEEKILVKEEEIKLEQKEYKNLQDLQIKVDILL